MAVIQAYLDVHMGVAFRQEDGHWDEIEELWTLFVVIKYAG